MARQLNCELLKLLITYSLILLSVTYSIDLNHRPSPTLMLQFMSMTHRIIDKVWKFLLRPLPFYKIWTEFGLLNTLLHPIITSVRKWDISLYIDCRLNMGSSCTMQPRSTLEAVESGTTVFLILSALSTAHVCRTIDREPWNKVADRQSVITLILTSHTLVQ